MTDAELNFTPPPWPHDSKPAAYELVAFQLRTAILTGFYRPGDALKRKTIAKLLGVSPTPVREAMRTLEAEGLLRITPQLTALVDVVHLDEPRELLAATLILETYAARELMARGRNIGELESLQRSMRELVADSSPGGKVRFVDLDVAFHRGIARLAGLANVELLLGRLRNRTRILVPLDKLDEERRAMVLDEHEAVLSALRSRDPAAVADAVRMHVVNRAGRWFKDHADYLRTLEIYDPGT